MAAICKRCTTDYGSYDLGFYKNRGTLSGYDYTCKQCRSSAESLVKRKRRQAAYYEMSKHKTIARLAARKKYGSAGLFKCSVLNCDLTACELHHVTYEDALAVVPFCEMHHRLDHETCKLGK